MQLSFDLSRREGIIHNICKAICIWDFRSFDDDGCYGRMPDGWFRRTYPFLDYVILMTFTGGAGRGEWYQEDEGGTARYDFSTPLRVLKNVLRQGVKPVIVLGNVPSAMSKGSSFEYDSYEWGNRCPPDDDQQYRAYIYAFGLMIREHFSEEEYRQWAFRVGTECDNPHWWIAGEEAYMKLYDDSVDALQEALGRENLTVFSSNISRKESFQAFFAHCHHGINTCTGEIGTQNDALSISHYNDLTPDGGCEYTHLAGILSAVQKRAEEACPGVFKSFNVGEGQYIMDGGNPPFRLSNGQDASSYAASWTAHMCDRMTAAGADYFANWAYAADSMDTQERMLRLPAWYVADFMKDMAGGFRVSPVLLGHPAHDNSVGGFASASKDGAVVRLMLYNHCLSRENLDENITLSLSSDQRYACRAWIISPSHTGFFEDWLSYSARMKRVAKDVDIATVGSVYDNEIASLLRGDDLQKWLQKKAEYIARDTLAPFAVDWRQNAATLTLPGHSVCLMELKAML